MANVSHIKIDDDIYDITPASPVSVGNGTLTIQKNGANVQTFTANQSSNTTANITMDKSDVGLENVGNFKAVSTVANQGLTNTEQSNARANIGAGTSNLAIGTTASTAAAGNHTHTTSIATSTATNQLSMAANTKYALTAGGTSYVFTTPPNPSIGNGTLTIQKNGANVQTFTANQSSNATANITMNKSDVGLGNVANLDQSKAIKSITRSGTTFTATALDGTTSTFTQQDNNTTYSANNGVGLSGTTFYNTGVRATTINGNYLRVNTNGTNSDLTIPYSNVAGSVAWGGVSSKPTWSKLSDNVTSTSITFTNGWKQAKILLKDSSTGKAVIFDVHSALMTSNNTLLCGGYFYSTADCCSFILFINTSGIAGKSVTINGNVRTADQTTISVLISLSEV